MFKCKKIPVDIQDKAKVLLIKYKYGEVHARKSGKFKYLSISITPWYRLLYKKGTWLLLTHAQYDREIDRK